MLEIEYNTKQEQTRQVVQAQTKEKPAEQDKMQQKIAYEAAMIESKKIKELVDAEAYAKARAIQADGALEKKLSAYTKVQK